MLVATGRFGTFLTFPERITMNSSDLSPEPRPFAKAFDPEHRARVVAAIRQLADFVEQRTELPVPQSIAAQYSIIGSLDDAGRELVRDAATALGMEPNTDDKGAWVRHELARSALGQPLFFLSYAVHGVVRDDEEPGDA